MKNNSKEANYYLLKNVATYRLSPDGISAGLFCCLLVSILMNLFLYFAVNNNFNVHQIWQPILKVSIILTIIQFFITVFYANYYRAYKYQKSQIYIFCFVTLKMQIEVYYAFFSFSMSDELNSNTINLVILLLIGGFILLGLSLMRAFFRILQGKCKENGPGLLNFKQSKGYLSLPFIIIATVVGVSLTNGNDVDFFNLITMYFFPLSIAIGGQYVMALLWPEFFLLAYCKSKFGSFIIPVPLRHRKKRGVTR
ncbi:hypothetical protein [Cytobacillus sp. IB215316]|uniref:hypothetical protein n=1 Tax=Cytobacillus sp. IB215316 TaxID=3097354 RepID=UPI002A0E6676|nr:hypothetical protein [Cytobacillus sp. IB215316]MDX8360752.1 hypothetical protein [Cytobacillus sp. IB215316]